MNKDIRNQTLIKDNNRHLVMKTLWENSPVSRAVLARLTALNKATITNLVSEMDESGIIKDLGYQSNGVGRSSNLIMLNADILTCAGISVSTTSISVMISDIYAKQLWREDFPFDAAKDPVSLMEELAGKVSAGLSAAGRGAETLQGIAIGLPSVVNRATGQIYAAEIINWRDIPVRDIFHRHFNTNVFVDTITNHALLGERWFGEAQNIKNAVYLRIGKGIGTALLLDGNLYTGHQGYAGYVSHMTIEPNGPLCKCGKRGCWELLASALAFDESVSAIRERAENGDVKTLVSLEKIGTNLAKGIYNIISMYNPEVILIGGSMAQLFDYYIGPCRAALRGLLLPPIYESTQIKASKLAADSAIIGAVTDVIDHYLNEA